MKQALVVDGDPIVCDTLQVLLQNAFPSIDIKVSSGADGALKDVCCHPWAFVVLDIHLLGQNGIDIIKRARTCCSSTPIVVFSTGNEYASRALRAGAVAYLSKEHSPQDLVSAVKALFQGVPDQQATVVHPVLSKREAQVLTLLIKGNRRKEISQQLHIGEGTVSTYRLRLLDKLNVRSPGELIRSAVEEGWLNNTADTSASDPR